MLTVALANLPFPESPESSVDSAVAAIGEAAAAHAEVICFPECYVPGYRAHGSGPAPASAEWLAAAMDRISAAAAAHHITVVMGTERIVEGQYRISVAVLGADGELQGWQDKRQLDPSEDAWYAVGAPGREIFHAAGVAFAVTICHEGFRYPETVREGVRRGAQVVFHPHYSWFEPGDWLPNGFAEAGNSFHEASARCRAAENNCWFLPVNHASPHSPTTSAVIAPDGQVQAWQPHGQPGLLIATIDPQRATRRLALRLRTGWSS